MANPTLNSFPIHGLMRERYSPLGFAERPVETDKLQSLLEAARWAPSCYNEQPWVYLVARRENKEEFATMLDCLVEANRPWASRAGVLMISVASLKFARNGKPNRHGYHDVGLATMALTIQAQSVGLYVHQMGGYDSDKVKTEYGIPDDYESVAAMAVGYLGSVDGLDKSYQDREAAPRSRKPLAEMVYSAGWGKTASFATS